MRVCNTISWSNTTILNAIDSNQWKTHEAVQNITIVTIESRLGIVSDTQMIEVNLVNFYEEFSWAKC